MARRRTARDCGADHETVREIAEDNGVSRALCYYVASYRPAALKRSRQVKPCPKCGGRGLIVDVANNTARWCECRPRPAPRPPAPAPASRTGDFRPVDLGAAVDRMPFSFTSAPAGAGASGSGDPETGVRRPELDVVAGDPDPPAAGGGRPEVAAGASRRPSFPPGGEGRATTERGLRFDSRRNNGRPRRQGSALEGTASRGPGPRSTLSARGSNGWPVRPRGGLRGLPRPRLPRRPGRPRGVHVRGGRGLGRATSPAGGVGQSRTAATFRSPRPRGAGPRPGRAGLTPTPSACKSRSAGARPLTPVPASVKRRPRRTTLTAPRGSEKTAASYATLRVVRLTASRCA